MRNSPNDLNIILQTNEGIVFTFEYYLEIVLGIPESYCFPDALE